MSTQELLHKTVFTAYLQPLLVKHASNKVITYEDLTTSWQAALAVLRNQKEQKLAVLEVQKQIMALHQNQQRAYREAAKTALQEWVETCHLPQPSPSLDLTTFQQQCRSAAEETRPAWHANKPLQKTLDERIEERATLVYNNMNQGDEEEGGEVDEPEQDVEEDDKEGEMKQAEEEDEDGNEEKEPDKNMDNKQEGILPKKRRISSIRINSTKGTPQKKKVQTKPGPPSSTRGRRGRGRGGASV